MFFSISQSQFFRTRLKGLDQRMTLAISRVFHVDYITNGRIEDRRDVSPCSVRSGSKFIYQLPNLALIRGPLGAWTHELSNKSIIYFVGCCVNRNAARSHSEV
ncbi:uncharacterized protein LOC114311954 [Camellia sinensis]|uniref:uncharacterized protein LOC114311954 n=1 Tax=Camellia sinensis TaxID=4442 RepID=UPI001035A5B2|nr:uncharacterized protein LOC114311954 [Camellia sinensis]XP_028113917.1 uncharacterized protein LOC114311954 [Camellia sinensis]XP_028113918.1 uncharacterized protein LOC114311954 [Camellia sinensis]XP_028113919.1 uncharacterized protein LOC114311954 [Camellia sinensis]